MLSAATLARHRQQIGAILFDSTCEVIRTPTTEGNAGGTIEGEPAVVATYDCRVTRASTPREEQVAEQTQSVQRWEIRLPTCASIEATDLLRVGGEAGTVYRVEGSDAGRSGALHLTVTCVVAE